MTYWLQQQKHLFRFSKWVSLAESSKRLPKWAPIKGAVLQEPLPTRTVLQSSKLLFWLGLEVQGEKRGERKVKEHWMRTPSP